MEPRDLGRREWIAIGIAVYVFTTLMWLQGWPLARSLFVVAGPMGGYLLMLVAVGRVAPSVAERVKSASGWVVGFYLAVLLAASFYQRLQAEW
jgi:hypothetical protein